jgi:hypothetical protein
MPDDRNVLGEKLETYQRRKTGHPEVVDGPGVALRFQISFYCSRAGREWPSLRSKESMQ